MPIRTSTRSLCGSVEFNLTNWRSISTAARTADLGSGNSAIAESPIVLITLPACCCTAFLASSSWRCIIASPAVSPLRSKKLVEPATSVNRIVNVFLCLRSFSSISARAFRSTSTSSLWVIILGHCKDRGPRWSSQWPPGYIGLVQMYLRGCGDFLIQGRQAIDSTNLWGNAGKSDARESAPRRTVPSTAERGALLLHNLGVEGARALGGG